MLRAIKETRSLHVKVRLPPCGDYPRTVNAVRFLRFEQNLKCCCIPKFTYLKQNPPVCKTNFATFKLHVEIL